MRIGLGIIIAALANAALAKTPPPIVQTHTLAPPIRETYQDWTVSSSSDLYFASTGNASGSTFGLICDQSQCKFYLNTRRKCEAGATPPGLFNSSAGALNLSFKCVVLDRSAPTIYILVSQTDINPDAFVGSEIGVVIPIDNGDFGVARFSTYGAKAAMSRAAQLSGATGDHKSNGPLDSVL